MIIYHSRNQLTVALVHYMHAKIKWLTMTQVLSGQFLDNDVMYMYVGILEFPSYEKRSLRHVQHGGTCKSGCRFIGGSNCSTQESDNTLQLHRNHTPYVCGTILAKPCKNRS